MYILSLCDELIHLAALSNLGVIQMLHLLSNIILSRANYQRHTASAMFSIKTN